MSENPPAVVANIYPCLRYRDARTAIAWLAKAFGFERHAEHPAPDGSVGHAEMRLGAGFIMLGSLRDDAFRWKSPLDLGGVSASVCVAIDDPDDHFAQACEAGAEIVQPLEDTPYGARGYTARDLEGNLWHFSNYRPAPTGMIGG